MTVILVSRLVVCMIRAFKEDSLSMGMLLVMLLIISFVLKKTKHEDLSANKGTPCSLVSGYAAPNMKSSPK